MQDALVTSARPVSNSTLFHNAVEVLKEVNKDLGKERLFSENIKVSKLLHIVDDKRQKLVAKINMVNEKLKTAKVNITNKFNSNSKKYHIITTYGKKSTSNMIKGQTTMVSLSGPGTYYSPSDEERLKKRVDEKIDSAINEYFSENKIDNQNSDEFKDGEAKGSAKVMRDRNHFKSDSSAPDISQ